MKKFVIGFGLVLLYLGIVLVSYHTQVKSMFYCPGVTVVKACTITETVFPYVILGEAVSLLGVVTEAIGTVIWKEEILEVGSDELSKLCPWCGKWWKESYITVHQSVCKYNPDRAKYQQDFFH